MEQCERVGLATRAAAWSVMILAWQCRSATAGRATAAACLPAFPWTGSAEEANNLYMSASIATHTQVHHQLVLRHLGADLIANVLFPSWRQAATARVDNSRQGGSGCMYVAIAGLSSEAEDCSPFLKRFNTSTVLYLF